MPGLSKSSRHMLQAKSVSFLKTTTLANSVPDIPVSRKTHWRAFRKRGRLPSCCPHALVMGVAGERATSASCTGQGTPGTLASPPCLSPLSGSPSFSGARLFARKMLRRTCCTENVCRQRSLAAQSRSNDSIWRSLTMSFVKDLLEEWRSGRRSSGSPGNHRSHGSPDSRTGSGQTARETPGARRNHRRRRAFRNEAAGEQPETKRAGRASAGAKHSQTRHRQTKQAPAECSPAEQNQTAHTRTGPVSRASARTASLQTASQQPVSLQPAQTPGTKPAVLTVQTAHGRRTP